MKKLKLEKKLIVKLDDTQASQVKGGDNTSYVLCPPWCDFSEECIPDISKTVTGTLQCPTDNTIDNCYCTCYYC